MKTARTILATALCLTMFGCGGGGGGGGDPNATSRPVFATGTGFLQYRTFEDPSSNRCQLYLSATVDGSPIETTDVLEVRVVSATGARVVAQNEGLWRGRFMFLNCDSSPCSQAGPIVEHGFWQVLPALAAGTYTVEVETADGQLLQVDIGYPGDLSLPTVPAASMQSQWNSGDLVLTWTNPTTGASWNEVDQLRIVVFDGAGKDVLFVRAAPSADSVTIPGALVSSAAGLGDGRLMRWEVQTRAHDTGGMNLARGYSRRMNLAAGPGRTFSFESAYLQYRTAENPAANRYRGFVSLTVDGAPVADTDILALRLLDSSGAAIVPVNEGSWDGRYLLLNCSSVPCTQSGPIETHGFWQIWPILVQDTYTYEVDTADGQTLRMTVDYGGHLALPTVTSASMQSAWSGGDLVLSWVNPTTEVNWQEVEQLRIVVFDDGGDDVLYVRTTASTSSVTIPASLVAEAETLGGGPLSSWEVQTRGFDANNMNDARGYSVKLDLATP